MFRHRDSHEILPRRGESDRHVVRILAQGVPEEGRLRVMEMDQ